MVIIVHMLTLFYVINDDLLCWVNGDPDYKLNLDGVNAHPVYEFDSLSLSLNLWSYYNISHRMLAPKCIE